LTSSKASWYERQTWQKTGFWTHRSTYQLQVADCVVCLIVSMWINVGDTKVSAVFYCFNNNSSWQKKQSRVVLLSAVCLCWWFLQGFLLHYFVDCCMHILWFNIFLLHLLNVKFITANLQYFLTNGKQTKLLGLFLNQMFNIPVSTFTFSDKIVILPREVHPIVADLHLFISLFLS